MLRLISYTKNQMVYCTQDFKTSYVTVNHTAITQYTTYQKNFKTSYVTVNLRQGGGSGRFD